ncbi:peptidoglycan-binding protein [Pyxidicoccus fallax]|uniref:Peptidoglycan-binding protein n=1 Tax=Pyxidicoccus fallax TaxID=394095 RepID=A0A848LJ32_9BACT|nr:peptidoglycan-binding domain-containing protein [Pyxidicoccus fallax]NMO17698.1 peptidoglycan-binding protein [Pyxidicoccus fallax]NPC80911.1 peptidoglycan-binding protein [Pyxidicoccus fallax]
MPRHTVTQGECLLGIALRHGFQDWKRIYEHPENAELRRIRPHPHVLHPGDVLFIPERQAKELGASTGKTHVFKVKQPMRELCLTLKDAAGKPLANEPYTLEWGAEFIEGATDGEGLLQEQLPLRLDSVRLTVGERGYELRLATLNPVEHTGDKGVSGIQARLRNLGFEPGSIDGVLSERTRQALCAFEALHGLPVTGEPAGRTLEKLVQAHGC